MDHHRGELHDARRLAIRRAIGMGAACALGCFAFGKPLENGLTDGAIVAVGGLVAWTTYHLISRRTDSLMLVALNTLPVWRGADDPWLPTLVITGLSMLGVGLVMGYVNRPEALGKPDPAFPWWEAELDGAA